MRLLRSHDFRLLVVSNGLSSLGDELALIALTIKVFDVSHGSGIAVAAVLLAGIVPLVVFAPLSGLIVDRTETTGTLAVASSIQAGIAVGLAFAHPVWLIVGLSFLLGSVASVASPAVFAIVPSAVDEQDLTEANGNMETARYIGMVLGPILAVALAKSALLVDAITFLIITSAAASLTVRRPPEPAPGEGRPKGEARQGFVFIRRDRVLLIGIVAISFAVLFGTIDTVAEVFFARDRSLLNAGNWGYGGLAAAWLVGMVIGAGWIAQKLKEDRLAPALLVATVGSGVAVATAAAFPTIALALGMFVLGGIGNGVSSVSIRSLIHHRVPSDLRGRAFAAFFSLAFAGQVVATVLGGVLLATLSSSQDVLLIGGFGSIGAGLLCLAWFAAIPRAERASIVVVPETEPVERRLVVVRDITPAEELADEHVEMLPSVEPSS